MTIGDKIKDLRKEKGYSQEQLAQELYVSRAAVAKWEAGNGIPDIENLKKLSSVFVVSIDELLDNHLPAKDVGSPLQDGLLSARLEWREMNPSGNLSDNASLQDDSTTDYYHQFMGRRCDIDLRDWNEGEYEIYVVGYDERFVYYLKEEGKPSKGKSGSKKSKGGYERIIGAINKSFIDSVSLLESGHKNDNKREKKKDIPCDELPDMLSEILADTVTESSHGVSWGREISKEFFAGKTADVYLDDKYIWSGILTKSTELFDVGIKRLDGEKLVLVTDRIIEIKDISKIEVNLSEYGK